MVDRYKVGYNMWLTNTGSSADFENLAQVPGSNGRYALFAPHVLMDYYGWNTGMPTHYPVRFDTEGNSTIKQVASGRFGVTAERRDKVRTPDRCSAHPRTGAALRCAACRAGYDSVNANGFQKRYQVVA